MTLRINMNAGAAVNGGPGIGIMTSAGNPWAVPDALAQAIVNRGSGTYVNPPQNVDELLTPEVAQLRALVPAVGARMPDGRLLAAQDVTRYDPVSSAPPVTAMLSESNSLAANTANFNSLVNDMDPGQIMLLPAGTYLLDAIPKKPVRVFGAAVPEYNGSTLVGGTILRGEARSVDVPGVEFGYFGINQTGLNISSYPNAITCGLSLTDSTTLLNGYVHDVVCLGRGFGNGQNSQHGILVQNGRGVLVERFVIVGYNTPAVARASGIKFKSGRLFQGEFSSLLFKSAAGGSDANDCFDCSADDIIAFADGTGKAASVIVQAQDGTRATKNASITNARIVAVNGGQAQFSVLGPAGALGVDGVVFQHTRSTGSTAAAAYLQNDDGATGVQFLDFFAEGSTDFGIRSNATTAGRGATGFGIQRNNAAGAYGAGSNSWKRLIVNGAVTTF